jgi:hypothetical protein
VISLNLLAAIAFGVVAVAGAVVTGIWGPRARARRRLARGVQRIAEGEVVTLVGTVRQLGDLVEAPLSGRACIAYDAAYLTPRGSNPTVIHQRSMTAFELVTADGPVLVEQTETLDVALPVIPVIPRKLGREQGFLERHSRSPGDAAGSTAEEAIVEPGDKIAVQGVVVLDAVDHGDHGYRDAPTRVRLVGHPKHPLTIGKP